MDSLTKEERSKNMRAIRSKNMRPEMIVRRLMHRLGYRYRLHKTDLPGKPDLVFRSRRKAIFVHGCFWHQHKDSQCKIVRVPKSRLDYWLTKLTRNVKRDEQHMAALEEGGWDVLCVWECEIERKDLGALAERIVVFMES